MEKTSGVHHELNIPTGAGKQKDVAQQVDVVADNLVDRLDVKPELGSNLSQLVGSSHGEMQQRTRKRKYYRHTEEQIKELESFFEGCAYPDEKQLNALSRKLGLEMKQVKFWFQNHRIQIKAQHKRHGIIMLHAENNKLRTENQFLRTNLINEICNGCGGPVIPAPLSFKEQQLRWENSILEEMIIRVRSVCNNFLGIPLISSTLASSSSGAATTRLDGTIEGLNLGTLPSSTPIYEKLMYVLFSQLAMNEFTTMVNIDGFGNLSDVLNLEEYDRMVVPNGLWNEANKVSRTVLMRSLPLVELLMDVNLWSEAFTGLVSQGTTLDIISFGVDGTRNGTLQMMSAEFYTLSPMVPARHTKFLRSCKKLADGVWAVMDLSLSTSQEASSSRSAPIAMRSLPSGCIIHDLFNGCCEVTWVDNSLYNENSFNQFMQPMVSSGMGFGATRWIATLQRYCESIAILMSCTHYLPQNHSMAGKKSLFELSRRMVNLYCSGVSVGSSSSMWAKLLPVLANMSHNVSIMVRKNSSELGETIGVTLSASTSVWLPISRRTLFQYLVNHATRKDWDVLANGEKLTELFCLPKTNVRGNSISVFHTPQYGGSPGPLLILQEIWNDESSSLMVYAPVDMRSMQVVMNGGDTTSVSLLPSGFAIFPDSNSGVGSGDANTSIAIGSTGGCIMTVGFQIFVSSNPTVEVTRTSVEFMDQAVSCTIKRIKDIFQISEI